MKKKILSILITVLAFCACMFTLTACGGDDNGNGDNLPHTHNYTTLKFDSENHWFECECKEKYNIAAHNIVNGQCVCGYVEPHTHDYTEFKHNETQHWNECVCGDKDSVENHKGGNATCTELAKCSVCNVEYGSLMHHNYTKLGKDATGHWNECVCGDKICFENHIPGLEATETTDQICTECNYVIVPALGHVHTLHLTKVDEKSQSCTEEGNIEYYICSCGKWFADNTATTEITDKDSVIIEKDEHNHAILKHNATEHWNECSCGDKSTAEGHKGGTATCTEKAKCEVCATEYGEANGHNYSSEITEPTCEEQGYTTYTCHCSDSYVADYVNALGHTTVIDKAVASTCTETGLTEGKHCSTCNEVLVSQLEIPSLGHSYQQTIITDDCSAPYGIVEYNCDNCGDSYSGKGSKITLSFSADGYGQVVNSSGAYTYYSYKITQNGGYGKVLIKYELYSNSSLSNLVETWDFSADKKVTIYLTRNIDISNYVFKITAKDEIGNKSVYCFRLGDSAELSKTISKFNEHTPSDWIISKEPTCTETGSKYIECSICKTKIETQEIAMLPHVEGDWITTLEPTCLEEGTKYQECSVCHSELEHASIDALGHDYTGKIDETTTCEKAVGTATCTRCNAIETIIVEHITINVELLNESFNQLQSDDYGYYEKLFSINTNGGYGTILYKYELFSSTTATKPQKTVDFTEDNTIKLSFTGYGSALANYYYRVTVKDEVGNLSIYTFDISLDSITKIKVGTNAEHTPGNWIVDLAPTCTEIGGKYQECSVCHCELDRGTVDATGHTEGDWIIDVEPTCTKVGSKHKDCVVCKEQLVTDNIAALGHTESDWIIDLEPTCEDNGSKHKVCTVCNQFLFAEIIYPHNLEDGFCEDCGAEFDANGVYFELSSDKTSYSVVKYGGKTTNLIIPSKFNDKPVTKIDAEAFLGCNHLKSIVIPDSVTSIGFSALYGCTNLMEIKLPFVGATKDGTSNTHFGYIFGASSYSYNSSYVPSSLASVVITGGNSISSYAFYGCSSLTSISVPNSVTSIGSSAFTGCSGLTEITLPFVGAEFDVTSSTYQYPFGYIFGTSSYAGGAATTQTYYYSSYSTTSSTYYIPTSLTKVTIVGGNIRYGAFYNCISLMNIIIGDKVTYIGGSAFYNCRALTSITIPDSVTNIGAGALSGCNSLTSVTLPFVGRFRLSSSYSDSGFLPLGYIFGTSSYYGGTATVQYYYDYYYDSSSNRIVNSTFYIPNTLKEVTITGGGISYGAFMNCSHLTSITIPDSLTSIGEKAFAGCSGLTNITIPDGVTSIGKDAFYWCSSLTRVDISDIESWCHIWFGNEYSNPLSYAKKLYLNSQLVTELTIPNSVQSVESYAFYNFSDLASITLPDTITAIGISAFSGCSNLTSVTIPDSVTRIGANAFHTCSSLTRLEIPDSVISIGEGAFSGCNNLISIKLPFVGESSTATDFSAVFGYVFGYTWRTNSSAQVGETYQYREYNYNYASYVCYYYYIPASLKQVTITGGLISSNGFYNCKSLTSVIIGDDVTSIGSSAFAYCSSLTSMVIGDSVATIGSYAFHGCSSLESITLPFIGGSKSAVSASSSTLFGYIFGDSSYDASIAIKQYYSSSGYVTYYIPSILKSVTITGGNVLYGAFYNCRNLTSIVISNSVATIGSYAFSNCNGLTSITIPNSVTSLGSYVFNNCSTEIKWEENSAIKTIGKVFQGYKGTNLTIPSSVTSIQDGAFLGCSSLISVKIGDGVKSIGSSAFFNCTALTSIEIPDSVTSMGSGAFESCSSLASITIGNGLASIPRGAFYKCYLLTSANVGSGVRSIGEKSFYGCSNLTSIILPDTIESIDSSAFSGCNLLTYNKKDGLLYLGSDKYPYLYLVGIESTSIISAVIDAGCKVIGDRTFYNCTSLTSVTIGDSLTNIGAYAFCGCSGLTNITIPDSVTSIGSSAFSGCTSLTRITLPFVGKTKDGTSYTHFGYIFGASSYTSNDDYVPTSLKTVVITGGKSIGDRAFYNCDSLTSVVIGDSVESIGEDAFYSCDSLTSVVIGDSVTSIGSSAFYYCDSLTSVVIGDSVTSIGEDAFEYCYKLVEVVNKSTHITVTKESLSNGYIGYYALAVYNSGDTFTSKLSNDDGYIIYTDGNEKILVDYNGMEMDLVLPSYITKINQYAFRDCDSLTSIVIPNSVTSIGARAFHGCNNLTSVTIGNSVTSIGDSAFSGCSSLTSIVIPDNVTFIGSSAFSDCSSLTSVTFEEGSKLTSIGDYAFDDCSLLTIIEIPNSVTSIGSYAFMNCSNLTSVYFNGTVEEWEEISIGSNNTPLTSATCYYYSENKPTTTGNYWHYVDGIPTKW